MKKILLVIMVLVGLLSTVSAKDFNEPRWKTVFSDGTETLKLDVNTVSYDEELDIGDAWIAKINIDQPRQEVVHYKVYFGGGSVRVVDALLYTPDSNVVVGRRAYDYFMDTKLSKVPKTVWNTVKQLTNRDAKKAAYEKKLEEEYEAVRQERLNRPVLTINRTAESQ